MMYTRAERIGQVSVVALALVFAVAVGGSLFGRSGAGGDRAGASASPAATASLRAPSVTLTQPTCCTQTARALVASWASSERVLSARVVLVPDPGFPCSSTLDPSGTKGVMTCTGLLRGSTDYVATLMLMTVRGTFPFEQRFRTMANALTGVKWFTEFEDPTGDPLACAAASVRIVQNFTAGADPMSATDILKTGQAFNKSGDPGLDVAAIATMQKRLDARNNYHYYRLATREEATKSAVYWLVRSGKPVHVVSLAGQHDPVLIGFSGAFGTWYDDPVNAIAEVIVEDPQRGDMRPETANRRPDKYRTPGFQTGQPISLEEWYGDEWWLAYPLISPIRMPDGSLRDIERNDGAYPTPHWRGTFIIIVDDGDAEWPSDKEGRVKWH